MTYHVTIEQIIEKTYGKELTIEAEDQAREIAEDMAAEASTHEIESEWEIWLDPDTTWKVKVMGGRPAL